MIGVFLKFLDGGPKFGAHARSPFLRPPTSCSITLTAEGGQHLSKKWLKTAKNCQKIAKKSSLFFLKGHISQTSYMSITKFVMHIHQDNHFLNLHYQLSHSLSWLATRAEIFWAKNFFGGYMNNISQTNNSIKMPVYGSPESNNLQLSTKFQIFRPSSLEVMNS